MRLDLTYGMLLMGSLLALGACKSSGTTTGSGGGGPGTGSGGASVSSSGTGGGSGGSGPGAGGWTALALLDDDTDPKDVVSHAGEDRVAAIHFSSLDQGLVATEGAMGTTSEGGMLYHAGHHQMEGVALSGRHAGVSGQEAAFQAIFPTKSGYAIGLGSAETTAISSDGGKTFSLVVTGISGGFAVAELMLREGSDGKWTFVGDNGVISEAGAAPSPSTTWTEIWAPEGVPPTPDPIPAGQCTTSPTALGVPHGSSIHASLDRQFLAYPAGGEYRICISHDGGKSFFPKVLPSAPEGAGPLGPTGILFISPQVGFAYDGYDLKMDGSFIYRTTDGGETWALASLPAEVTQEYSSIRHVFFAPDAVHGFAVGYTGDRPLLMRTADAGATWTVPPGAASLRIAMKSLDAFKLYAGFALDETHLWVGGEHGAVFANDAGGD